MCYYHNWREENIYLNISEHYTAPREKSQDNVDFSLFNIGNIHTFIVRLHIHCICMKIRNILLAFSYYIVKLRSYTHRHRRTCEIRVESKFLKRKG